MGQAIGDFLPLAAALAINPLPIIAVVLILSSSRAGANGLAFIFGWFFGLGAAGAIMLAIVDTARASEAGAPAAWVSWTKILLGALLLLVAAKELRSRARASEGSQPSWMGRVEIMGARMAFGLAFVLATMNPKNLLLIAGGAAVIAETGIARGQQAIAFLVFSLIASIGVLTPLLIYFTMGDRAPDILGQLRDWMSRNSAVIIAVMCLVIGLKIIGDGIAALTG